LGNGSLTRNSPNSGTVARKNVTPLKRKKKKTAPQPKGRGRNSASNSTPTTSPTTTSPTATSSTTTSPTISTSGNQDKNKPVFNGFGRRNVGGQQSSIQGLDAGVTNGHLPGQQRSTPGSTLGRNNENFKQSKNGSQDTQEKSKGESQKNEPFNGAAARREREKKNGKSASSNPFSGEARVDAKPQKVNSNKSQKNPKPNNKQAENNNQAKAGEAQSSAMPSQTNNRPVNRKSMEQKRSQKSQGSKKTSLNDIKDEALRDVAISSLEKASYMPNPNGKGKIVTKDAFQESRQMAVDKKLESLKEKSYGQQVAALRKMLPYKQGMEIFNIAAKNGSEAALKKLKLNEKPESNNPQYKNYHKTRIQATKEFRLDGLGLILVIPKR